MVMALARIRVWTTRSDDTWKSWWGDVRGGGGVATIQQYLRAQLVDEMHLAIAPTVLGSGENLFAGIDLAELGYRCVEHVPSAAATHVVLSK
jgi:dihydrofolate reductase